MQDKTRLFQPWCKEVFLNYGGNMVSSKTTEPVSVPKKVIDVKKVKFENGVLVDELGDILPRLSEAVGDAEFGFKITLALPDEE